VRVWALAPIFSVRGKNRVPHDCCVLKDQLLANPHPRPFSQREKGEKKTTALLRNHVPLRVIDRHVAKRRHLVLDLVPVADNNYCSSISVEVFCRDALDVGRG
jgi:hypothetical protein